jgi:hypothetical protein
MGNRTIPLVPPPDPALWDDPARPLALGCTLCPDLVVCGGLRVRAGVFDCRALCLCARNGKKCNGVCRRDAQTFIAHVTEVGGWDLNDAPRSAPLALHDVAEYAPVIYDGTDRICTLNGGTVALPLLSLFKRASGTGRFDTRAEMLEAFRLSHETHVILTGVAEDRAIERWWSFADRPRLIASLHPLGIEMVTAPNYSLFTDVTRYDNLHNMKRIVLAWSEFMAGGMPCALHINGRNDRDYERWREFVTFRDEVTAVSFEFTTGTSNHGRGDYHCDQLVALARAAGRPLHLVVRGGRRHLQQLAGAFASLTVVDADPYVRTKHRQRARFTMGAGIEWRGSQTAKGEPLDGLLSHNVEVARHSTLMRLAWLRANYGHGEARYVSPLLEPSPA